MMADKKQKMDRRGFLKSVGAAGLGSAFVAGNTFGENKSCSASKAVEAGGESKKKEKGEKSQMPKRKLGRSEVEVPVLGMGGHGSFIDRQILLKKSVDWGVTYWDTSSGYANGNSEIGMGKFIGKYPELRKKIFIATRAWLVRKPEEIEKLLRQSQERMQTDYFDLYNGIHRLKDPEKELNDDIKQWVKKMKKEGVIRLFGCTTHENIPNCLLAAAKRGWIDVIMLTYNFRYMQDKKMQEAIDACHKAGIGLVAMKSQGHNQQKIETEADKKLVGHFLSKGFTEAQAKIKVVLEDERFSTVCVGMAAVNLLKENTAAVMNKQKLTAEDVKVFNEYAEATCSGYCAGCSNICEQAVPQMPYVNDIMRYLMYYNNYGDHDRARENFAMIPADVRNRLLTVDYSKAEARCPQGLPIAKFIAEAVGKLA